MSPKDGYLEQLISVRKVQEAHLKRVLTKLDREIARVEKSVNKKNVNKERTKEGLTKNNLKKIRKRRGLSLREVGFISGVAYQYVSMLENNKRTPSRDTAETISNSLELPVDEVFPCLPPPPIGTFSENGFR